MQPRVPALSAGWLNCRTAVRQTASRINDNLWISGVIYSNSALTNESPRKITFMNCVNQSQLRCVGIHHPVALSQHVDVGKGRGKKIKTKVKPNIAKPYIKTVEKTLN